MAVAYFFAACWGWDAPKQAFAKIATPRWLKESHPEWKNLASIVAIDSGRPIDNMAIQDPILYQQLASARSADAVCSAFALGYRKSVALGIGHLLVKTKAAYARVTPPPMLPLSAMPR